MIGGEGGKRRVKVRGAGVEVVRGAWCVVRDAWCVVRGAWCVVCGVWCVVVPGSF